MKVVDAVWEIKNLGKKTIELILEDSDFVKTPEEIYKTTDELRLQYAAEYTVIKMKGGVDDSLFVGNEFVKNGFVKIETQFHIKAVKRDIEFAAQRYRNFFRDTAVQPAIDKAAQEHIFSEIRKGIFFKDRISLDPEFGTEIANNRYANWTETEVQRGSSLYYVIFKGEKIGFSLRRYEKFSAFGLLSGLFNDYKNLNIGGHIFFAELYEDVKKGYKFFYGDVSSNNLTAFRLNEMFGYRLENFYEVYVRHNSY